MLIAHSGGHSDASRKRKSTKYGPLFWSKHEILCDWYGYYKAILCCCFFLLFLSNTCNLQIIQDAGNARTLTSGDAKAGKAYFQTFEFGRFSLISASSRELLTLCFYSIIVGLETRLYLLTYKEGQAPVIKPFILHPWPNFVKRKHASRDICKGIVFWIFSHRSVKRKGSPIRQQPACLAVPWDMFVKRVLATTNSIYKCMPATFLLPN